MSDTNRLISLFLLKGNEMKILVLNTLSEFDFKHFYSPDVRGRLEQVGDVHYMKFSNQPDEIKVLKSCIHDIDVLFTNWGVSAARSGFDSEFYAAANKLSIIAHTGGSVADLISDDIKRRSDLVLLSGNKYYAESVAQGTICYMLMAERKLYHIMKETESNGWCSQVFTEGLRGKTIGLLSFGMIAKNVAKMLQVFNCRVKVHSSHGLSEEELKKYRIESCTIEEMFSTCDIVSIHSGLTPDTYHIVNKKLLSMMKDHALLVNTSRGAVIDEAALELEVKSGRIRVVLDVMEKEPLPMCSGLRGLDNVYIIPHQGGPTTDLYPAVTHGLIDDIERYYSGNYDLENQISISYARNMTSHTFVDLQSKVKNEN